ncbi:FecR family protein [Chitinophaga varians]|uniref:FecR family protein n=1 Tax=Chitinophaga varians TaxID=2202339 RepID=UPI00165F4B04|nr:FecR domain-containing protein [Chitinophaga varians]MBC9915002.1 FecR domain-containing protein [Chitinophaga varians]
MMQLQRLKNIVSNYLSGQSSTEEKAIVEHWFREAKEASDKDTDHGQYNERKMIALRNIKAAIQMNPGKQYRLRWAMAASVISVIFAGYLFRNNLRNIMGAPAMYTVVTNQHQVREIILPDSSVVVLNVNSRLRYPEKFNSHRNVELSGEAFFDIRKNSTAAFTVKASHLDVKVLGTSFVVSDDRATETARVTVKTGRVQVVVPDARQEPLSILSASQQFTYAVRRREGKTERDVAVNTEWTSQLLVFRNTPLREVFAAMEGSLQVKIVSRNEEINKRTFTGSFLKEDDIAGILNILSLSYGLKIKQTGNLIEVN